MALDDARERIRGVVFVAKDMSEAGGFQLEESRNSRRVVGQARWEAHNTRDILVESRSDPNYFRTSPTCS